jgi:hypothetical protein
MSLISSGRRAISEPEDHAAGDAQQPAHRTVHMDLTASRPLKHNHAEKQTGMYRMIVFKHDRIASLEECAKTALLHSTSCLIIMPGACIP